MSNNNVMPLITTVISTFRRPEMLGMAIESVLKQTFPHFEVHVYDSASGDNTSEVVSEYSNGDRRVKYYCQPENIGAINNYNYGISRVKTPYFSLLSDDDTLLPEFFETAMEGFNKHDDILFSATAVKHVLSSEGYHFFHPKAWKTGYCSPPDGLFSIIKHGDPTWTGILFKKEVIEKVGLLDKEVGSSADQDFELRIAARFPFYYTTEVGAVFNIHPSSHSSQVDLGRIWPGWLKMIKNITDDKRISPATRMTAESLLNAKLKKRLFFMGIKLVGRKKFDDAYRVVEILGEKFQQKKHAYFILLLTKLVKWLPPTAGFLLFSIEKYRRFNRLR